jgi:hypothetical protein
VLGAAPAAVQSQRHHNGGNKGTSVVLLLLLVPLLLLLLQVPVQQLDSPLPHLRPQPPLPRPLDEVVAVLAVFVVLAAAMEKSGTRSGKFRLIDSCAAV